MEWTDIRLTVAKADAENAEAVATLIAEGGIYIEDYSDIEQQVAEIGPFHSTSLLLSACPSGSAGGKKFCHLYSTRFCARMQAPRQNRRRWYNVCTD